MAAPAEEAARVLLVEGSDDAHVIRHLCEREGLPRRFSTVCKNGIDALLKSIPNHLGAPRLTALGIVVDANTSPAGRWQSLAARLQSAGIAAPAAADPAGTVIPGDTRVGAWIMPDNEQPGEIEDFVALMIPTADPIWPRAERYINGIPDDHRRFAPNKSTRAKVHAWLAAQQRPRPMGLGITSGDLDPSDQTAQRFLSWIERLFNPTTSN
ncbi:MAG: hypothetical protein F4236_02620 [Acidimicrobiia bacterium]|nr:hypothetical protein [Acidimicrobiia bacterium]MYB24566.1 hypothetical protein [Acidimicrobiia bacterium]MYE67090.1 hypothetical protein [Acidimicrobiia bacterium]MYJ14803.1 hypothetical protein [Acidimicrobiia bacterium]